MSLSNHSSVYLLSNQEYDLLNKFSRAAWGHPKYLFKNLDASSEFIDLGEYFLAFQALFRGIVQHPRILVRDEYRVALDALQGVKYYRGAYVIGHPGIGKSWTKVWHMLSCFILGKTLFLVYLIIHFLGQKQAVAFQFPRDDSLFYAFFSQEGVSIQSDNDGRPLFNCPSFIWALCDDSNDRTAVPSDIFTGRPHHIRVIQTTAPVSSHWKSWSTQVGANRFVMDIWSTEEVRKLAIMLNLDVECMTELATKWGGDPRTLLDFLTDAEIAEDEICSTVEKAVQQCDAMLMKGEALNLSDNVFYFIRPRNTLRRHRIYKEQLLSFRRPRMHPQPGHLHSTGFPPPGISLVLIVCSY
ncbi:hypothetical protein OG21DRAFT_846630 [Imleria badia]|nr:hypothetical protein OG21DRAFT_846630 [Imleria badia]